MIEPAAGNSSAVPPRGQRLRIARGAVFLDNGCTVMGISPLRGVCRANIFTSRSRIIALLRRLADYSAPLDDTGTIIDGESLGELVRAGCLEPDQEVGVYTHHQPADAEGVANPTLRIDISCRQGTLMRAQVDSLIAFIGASADKANRQVSLRSLLSSHIGLTNTAIQTIASLRQKARDSGMTLVPECAIDVTTPEFHPSLSAFVEEYCDCRCMFEDTLDYSAESTREERRNRAYGLADSLTRQGFSCSATMYTSTVDEIVARASKWLEATGGEGVSLAPVFVKRREWESGRAIDGMCEVAALVAATTTVAGMLGRNVLRCDPWREILLATVVPFNTRCDWQSMIPQAFLSDSGFWSISETHASHGVYGTGLRFLTELQVGRAQSESLASSLGADAPFCERCEWQSLCNRYWSAQADVAGALGMRRAAANAADYHCKVRLGLLPQVLADFHEELESRDVMPFESVRARLEKGSVVLDIVSPDGTTSRSLYR